MNTKTELKKMFLSEDIEKEITTLVIDKEYTYLEAIIIFCEEKGVDVRDIPVIIPKSIKQHLEVECINNKLVKGTITVSIDDVLGE